MTASPTGTGQLIDNASRLRLVLARLSRRLRQHDAGGLTQSQLSALAVLEAKGPMRPGDLSATEGVGAPTMSRILAVLEERGLIERSPDPDDGRSILVGVTSEAATALAEVRRQRTAYLRSRLAELSDSEREALLAALPVLERLASHQ